MDRDERKIDKAAARVLALRRLGAREYSSAEMVDFLKRKGASLDDARAVVAQLIEERAISDERYAKMMTRHQVLRGKGPAYIRMKLKQKGIRSEAAEVKVLAEEVSGESDLERARRVVETRYPRAHSDRAEAARAYQALIRRGFSFDVAREVVFKGKDLPTES